LNIVIIILYRTGFGGEFLGIGGIWNLNEEKSADSEIFASGVMVIFLIYTTVQLMTHPCANDEEHKRNLSDTIMNVVGILLWLAVGGTALHYWASYVPEHDFLHVVSERSVRVSEMLPRALFLKFLVLLFRSV
jgi:hypothetical protein